jgi:DNA-directed RNA polymerase specialized sigma24 family protein
MNDLPSPWNEYARLQGLAQKISRIDSYSWGIEEEMASFLEAPSTFTLATAKRLNRVRQTAARRERARSLLRETNSSELRPQNPNPISYLEAREVLEHIKNAIESPQWELLLGHATGKNYKELGRQLCISPGAVRAKVFRLRQDLNGQTIAA